MGLGSRLKLSDLFTSRYITTHPSFPVFRPHADDIVFYLVVPVTCEFNFFECVEERWPGENSKLWESFFLFVPLRLVNPSDIETLRCYDTEPLIVLAELAKLRDEMSRKERAATRRVKKSVDLLP
jgi:hypothetical protein